MSKLFQPVLQSFWELLMFVPMPWRATLVILGVVLLATLIAWGIVPWLVAKLVRASFVILEFLAALVLLPEHWLSQRAYRQGHNFGVAHYAVGDVLHGMLQPLERGTRLIERTMASVQGRRWLPSVRWLLIIAVLPILSWYVRPYLGDIRAAQAISHGISWWDKLEGWALTGAWVPVATPEPGVDPTAVAPPSQAPPNEVPLPEEPAQIEHVVQPGEFLSKIAEQYNVPIEALVEANKDQYPSLVEKPTEIEIGWVFQIPTRKE